MCWYGYLFLFFLGYFQPLYCLVSGNLTIGWNNKPFPFSDYVKETRDAPEDALAEYVYSNFYGDTFPSQQTERLKVLRREWRSPTKEGHSEAQKELSEMEVNDILAETEEGPFPQPIPLKSMLRFLSDYWKQDDSDYPTPSRLQAMMMDELVQGSGCFFTD